MSRATFLARLRLPRLHPARLRHAPRIEAGAPEMAGDGGTTVQVRGLVCGVCATRTEAALRSVDGVEDVTVDLDAATASLRLSPGASVQPQRLQEALERAVIAMPVRRLIERAARRLSRARHTRRRHAPEGRQP
ncbi:MAG: heavy metal-associated domain-containing protein [Dehalococcoidia bacterium]